MVGPSLSGWYTVGPSLENHGHMHTPLEPQEAPTQRAVPAVSKDSLQPILGDPSSVYQTCLKTCQVFRGVWA